MITNETLNQINEKLEELHKLCEANGLPMIAMVFCEEIGDSTIFSGGSGEHQSLMVSEIIANLVEDMKAGVKPGDKITTRGLLSLLMGEIAEYLEVYLAKESAEKPEIANVMNMLSERIEGDIDARLNKIFVDKNPTPELLLEGKLAVAEVLSQYSLTEKVDFTIEISSLVMVINAYPPFF